MRKKINNLSCCDDILFCDDIKKGQSDNTDCKNETIRCVGPTGPTGQAGPDGQAGLSPYEVAVENGFVGTKEEWEESLNGQDAGGFSNGHIIPFAGTNGNTSYYKTDDEIIKHSIVVGFGHGLCNLRIENNSVNIMDVIDSDSFIAYSVPYDSTITAINADTVMIVSSGIVNLKLYVGLYECLPGSSVFNLIPDTITELTVFESVYPPDNTETFNAQKSNINYDVVAGTKLALLMFLDNPDVIIGNANTDCYGHLTAGVAIRSNN